MCRFAVMQGDAGAKRRAKHAQCGDGRLGGGAVEFFFGGLRFSGREALHAEGFGTMRVEKLQRPNLVFSDHTRDAGEGEFELFRFGRGWEEKSALRGARLGGRRGEMDFEYWRAGRVRFEIELQKLQENFGVKHGDGEVEETSEKFLSFKFRVSSFGFCGSEVLTTETPFDFAQGRIRHREGFLIFDCRSRIG